MQYIILLAIIIKYYITYFDALLLGINNICMEAHKKKYHGTLPMYHGTLPMYHGTLSMYHGTLTMYHGI